MPASTDRLIISASVAIDLHDVYQYPAAHSPACTDQRQRWAHIPNTSRWHLHSIYWEEGKHKCSGSVGALEECKPFLKTLFIFRFFLLAQQAAIFLAHTEGCLAHLVHSRRQRGEWGVEGGHGARSRPGGAGLTGAFYSDRHPAHWSLLL